MLSMQAFGAHSYLRVEPIALTGDPAPDVEPLVTFSGFGPPIMKGGYVAFHASIECYTIDVGLGIWAGEPGNLRLVAREDDPAPGADGHVFERFGPPRFDASGRIAFNGVAVDGESLLTGIWSEASGALTAIVLEGDVLVDDYYLYQEFYGTPDPTISSLGHLVFKLCCWSWTNRTGELTLFPPFDMQYPPVPDWLDWDQAYVADLAWVGGGRFAFVMAVPSYLPRVHIAYVEEEDGTLIVAVPPRTTHYYESGDLLRIESLRANPQGQIVYLADRMLDWNGGDWIMGKTIWRSDPLRDDYEQTLLAQEGDPAPGVDALFGQFSHPHITSSGEVVFLSTLTGEATHEGNNRAIWRAAGEDMQLVAREGDHAPGASPDVVFSDFQRVAVSDSSIIFYAMLTGITVSGDNDRALFITDGRGVPTLVARAGGYWDVAGDGSDKRVIKSIVLAQAEPGTGGAPHNGSTTVAFKLTFVDNSFVDNSAGLFSATIVDLIPGDVDWDGDVDHTDLAVLLSSYQLHPQHPRYVENADFDEDGDVDQHDLAILLANYGEGT